MKGGPADESIATAESSHKNDEQNPEFNEEFNFALETLDCVLNIRVMDVDLGREDKLGSAAIRLGDQDLKPGEMKEVEAKLDDTAACCLELTRD